MRHLSHTVERKSAAAQHEHITFDIGNIEMARVIPGTAPTAATRDKPQLTRRELMRDDFPVLGTPVTLRGGGGRESRRRGGLADMQSNDFFGSFPRWRTTRAMSAAIG